MSSHGLTAPASELAPSSRISTLPSWDWDPYDSKAPLTLGWGVCHWLEESSGLLQPNGPRAGKPFRLTADQFRFLLWWYAVDSQGQWLYSHGVRRLAKGSGKSPFAAVWALTEFVGPVRLAKKDGREMGGLIGRPVQMPLVQIAATAESQTANTMRMVRAFASKRSTFVRDYELDPGKTLYYRQPEGQLEIITSSATAAEGAESTAVVADETEHWKPSNGGPTLFATIMDNLAKSGSRAIETCNAWVPGVESVAEASWDDWLAQEEGLLRGETKVLYDARVAPPGTDMADTDSLKAALVHIYMDCDWKKPTDDEGDPIEGSEPDVRSIMERIYRKSAKPDESARKYLNWPTAAEDAWTDSRAWALLEDTTKVVAPADEIVLFFDGSKGGDATALIGCRMEDGHTFTLGVWEPDPKDPDDTVDANDVDRAVIEAFRDHTVVAFYADVREWESYALSEWPQRYGEDLGIWAAPNARPPQPIAWDMRGHVYEFSKACEATLEEIIAGGFTHDGDPRVARHVANARRRPYRDAVGIGKESRGSARKIDAAVCVVGARMLRRIAQTTPRRKQARQPGTFWGG